MRIYIVIVYINSEKSILRIEASKIMHDEHNNLLFYDELNKVYRVISHRFWVEWSISS